MDDRQISALCAHREADNPLYLRVSLQELLLFGAFKQLKARIESMAEDIPGLFGQGAVKAHHVRDGQQFIQVLDEDDARR
jgi:hypothetical protein